MVSNESLTALDWFLIEAGFPFGGTLKYNDVVRNIYDALFELNVECDFIPSDAPAERLAKYEMIVTPALYCTPQETTDRLREFVSNGGHLVSTMRSFVTDDEVTVWHDRAPHNLTDVFGMTYNQFTRPNGHPIRRHRRARRLRPLRMEGLRRGDPTRLRQGRRRMDRHPARRRYHPSCSTRSRGACGHRRCRHRARRTGDGASRNERSRRAGDVSAQLFRRRSHHRQPGVGRCGGRPGGSGFRRHR